MTDSLCCGIDFGTSNSTCAIYKNGVVDMVPLEGESPILPSALFFQNGGEVFFGRAAMRAYTQGEDGRLLRGLKSILGTSLMKETTIINGRAHRFEEILTIYLRNIKQRAEAYVGGAIEKVVMGRPVHFHDNNPNADAESEVVLKRIAHDIGFTEVAFQYEPIAAAYAHEQMLAKDKCALVVDLGGGTSDFTVINLLPPHMGSRDRANDILSTSGVRVGGTGFDRNLSLSCFMSVLGMGSEYGSDFDADKRMVVPMSVYHDLSEWHMVPQAHSAKSIRETKDLLRLSYAPEKLERLLDIQQNKLGHAFLQCVEQTKIILSDVEKTTTDLGAFEKGLSVDVDRASFNRAVDPLIVRIQKSLNDCLEEAGVAEDAIDLVILTGGTSEVPAVYNDIERRFARAEFSKSDKFGSVGRGLAYYAATVFDGAD